jgi:hypothetical protein
LLRIKAIGGAPGQRLDGRLLAQDAGDEDEGNIRRHFLHPLQGRHPVVRGQPVIREDDVNPTGAQGGFEFIARLGMGNAAGQPRFGKRGLNQLRVDRIIFQVKDVDGWLHFSAFPSPFFVSPSTSGAP